MVFRNPDFNLSFPIQTQGLDRCIEAALSLAFEGRMGIVDQKHHLPRQSPSAGYGKLSNGELFLIFISGSGKNPTKYSFVKIIHNFFPSHSCLFFPPSILCVRNGLEQIYFPELGEDPVSCEGVEIELWAEQHWDEVQEISLC